MVGIGRGGGGGGASKGVFMWGMEDGVGDGGDMMELLCIELFVVDLRSDATDGGGLIIASGGGIIMRWSMDDLRSV